MARSSINVSPDSGPDQSASASPRKRALAAIAQMKKDLGELEKLVKSINETKPHSGGGTSKAASGW